MSELPAVISEQRISTLLKPCCDLAVLQIKRGLSATIETFTSLLQAGNHRYADRLLIGM